MAGTRREFIGTGVGAAVVVGLGAAFWDDVFGAARSAASSPRTGYGPRRAANEHGLMLPEGFRSRLIARGDEAVPGTGYRWHRASDGAACFPTDDGGWILVSNSETLRRAARPRSASVRRGRSSPPTGSSRAPPTTARAARRRGAPGSPARSSRTGTRGSAIPTAGERRRCRPALGRFKHEAAAVDPKGRRVYLTEDLIDGRFYRFTPTALARSPRGPARGRHSGRLAGRSAGRRSRTPPRKHVPTRHQVRGAHDIQARRGHLPRRRDDLSLDDRGLPRPRLRHRAATGSASSTTASPWIRRRCSEWTS